MRNQWKKRAAETGGLIVLLLSLWGFIVAPMQAEIEELKSTHEKDVEKVEEQRRRDIEQINAKLDQLLEAVATIDERTRWLEKSR